MRQLLATRRRRARAVTRIVSAASGKRSDRRLRVVAVTYLQQPRRRANYLLDINGSPPALPDWLSEAVNREAEEDWGPLMSQIGLPEGAQHATIDGVGSSCK